MGTLDIRWPEVWRLVQRLPAHQRSELLAQVEAAALLLLHLRDDALKRQLEDDNKLQKWLRELLLQLPTAYECHSTDVTPLPETLQKLLLRVFLRLSRLQLVDHELQQLIALPCSACLDVCLCWEAADPALCCEVAATLLASLKPTKRQRLATEVRESVLCTIEASVRALHALSRRPDSPLVYSPLTTIGGDGASSPWQEAAASTLQPLIEALAVLRVATCCLPVSFALELWDGLQNRDRSVPTVEAMLNSIKEPDVSTQPPFSAPLRTICAALGCSTDGGTTECIVSDLEVSGIRCLLQQWRLADVNEDQVDYIDSILSTSKTGEGESTQQPAAPLEDKTSLVLTPEDTRTVREDLAFRQLQEMLPTYGPGFLYLALRELRGNADEVVSLLMENMEPANLRSVPIQATLQDASDFIEQEKHGEVPLVSRIPESADIKRQVLALARWDANPCVRSELAASEALEGNEDTNSSLYDDDADEELLAEAAASRWNPAEC
ncbi:hypothetical protein, conserved [Eimeria acervulina]|uniref:CUE domain-containing protein n=1 Tax=Eimeria acervulina TaxID=5801 RepID=U6GCK4_EIMAC|nr:hypothetical protein, conserved [Eimeria acervulina]CDI76319.1 hypothetical protein, conserved [Eimeria acervulina]